MQKQIEQALDLLNAVVIDQVQASLNPYPLGGGARVQRILLTAGEAEGLTIEDLRVGVQDVTLPTPEDKAVAATLRVDRLVLKVAPDFWGRAAVMAREKLVSRLGAALDRVTLDGLQVRAEMQPQAEGPPAVAAEVRLEKVQVFRGEELALQVDNLHARLENFRPGPDKKAALAASRLTLYSLAVRVAESFLQNMVEVVREKIPAMVSEVEFDLGGGTLLVMARVKVGLSLTGRAELQFRTNRNNFGIQFLKITGVPGASKLVPMLAGMLAAKLPEGIEAGGDYIWIEPWGKVPVPVSTVVSQFGVSNHQIVVEFTAPEESPTPRLRAPGEATALPTPDPVPPGAPVLPPLLSFQA